MTGDRLSDAGDAVSAAMREHYASCFAEHGATPRGVDWRDWPDTRLRYEKMLAVIEAEQATPVSLLDVGCGFGGLLDHAAGKSMQLNYTGVDLVEGMIAHARATHADVDFRVADIFALPDEAQFDYVVCNGILTQKLDTSIRAMDVFARRLIGKMFKLARRGIAFNVMTTDVNFMVPNLYYKNPLDMLALCRADLSRKFRIDQSYPLYEYTVYVYHEQ